MPVLSSLLDGCHDDPWFSSRFVLRFGKRLFCSRTVRLLSLPGSVWDDASLVTPLLTRSLIDMFT